MLSSIFLLLGLMLVGPGTYKAFAMPQMLFQTEFKLTSGTNGIYTNPRGVSGPSSPFVVVNNNSLQSFSAGGNFLHELPNMYVNIQPAPVMNTDAAGNTLFVAALPNGTVISLTAETLASKWAFSSSDGVGSQVKMMVYIEPELATNCSGSAGGLSLLMCNSASCTLRVLDFDTGVSCGNPTTLPLSLDAFMTTQGFPSGQALERPMIIVGTSNGIIYGIDAITGVIVYHFQYTSSSSSASFDFIVPGASPTNELFAYFTEYPYNGGYGYDIYYIATGELLLQGQFSMKKSLEADVGEAVWAPANGTRFGGLLLGAYPQDGDSERIVFLNAETGDIQYRQKLHTDPASSFVNGNGWTMFAETTGDSKVKCTFRGYPSTPDGPTFASRSFTFGIDGPWLGLYRFTFADGGVGMVAYLNPEDPTSTNYLVAFKLVP